MNFNEDILNRYFTGDCGPDEEGLVREWFATDEGQVYLAADMDRQINGGNEFAVNHTIRSEYMFGRIKDLMYKKEGKRLYYRVAAVILPFLLLNGLLWLHWNRPEERPAPVYHHVMVAKGEQLQVLLQDGTRVWLNADSRLSYPDNFNRDERVVKLEGEAYFEVAKNKARPFRVETDEMELRVTGTSFNVRAYREDSLTLTSLDEGGVELYGKGSGDEKYAIVPGQVASFSKNTGGCSVRAVDDIECYSAWKSDCLIFKKVPLEEVLKVLERKFDQKFEIVDREVCRYSYTISFRHMPLKEILKAMEWITPVRMENEGGVYKIFYRKPKMKSVYE